MLLKILIKKISNSRAIFAIPAIIAIALIIENNQNACAADTFNPEDAFYRANIYYGTGEYRKAAAENEKIIATGVRSGELYYNLGNCYLKSGNIGRAILNYEKARLFIPGDSALQANYTYAKSQMKQRDTAPKLPPFIQIYYHIFDNVTTGESGLTVTLTYLCFAILLSLAKFKIKGRFLIRIIALLFLFITLILIVPLEYKIRQTDRMAITVVKIADVKIEPLTDSSSSYPLYEGMRVEVVKKQKNWLKIRRPDGKVGWLKKEEVELVNR